MSIATAITDLQGRIEDAYDSIEDMGGTVPATLNSYNLPTAIESIPQGGGSEAEWKDVNFIDYDGKNLYSYTAQQALNLSALPELPNRSSEGLTCQEWNYTLAEVKANVNSCGKCTVGATYTTTDGKTHLFITIRDKAYRTVYLYFNQDSAQAIEVDWGDGSATSSSTYIGNTYVSHNYPDGPYPMTYEIKMENVGSAVFRLGPGNIFTGNNPSDTTNMVAGKCAMLDKVHIGQKLSYLSSNCFRLCRNLKAITIPYGNNVRAYEYSLAACPDLKCVIFPRGGQLSNGYVFYQSGIERLSVPYTISFGMSDIKESSLQQIVLGNSAGQFSSTFVGCSSLNSVYNITDVVDTCYKDCYSLSDVSFRTTNNQISIGSMAFQNWCQ